MAYDATVTVSRRGSEITVTIDETDAGATDEATIDLDGLARARLVNVKSFRSAGTGGATVNPILGNAANPTGTEIIFEPPSAANPVSEPQQARRSFNTSSGLLYHRSRLSVGANNTVKTVYHLLVGWGD